MLETEREREAQAAKMWSGGMTHTRATLPSWAYDSVGDWFFSDDDIIAAAAAPPLAEAILPSKEELSQDPAHWAVAVSALVRGVALLQRRLDDAFTGLGTGLTGAVAAEALIRAVAGSYRCEMPGDAECLKRLGPTRSGNPLHDLILAKAVAPKNSLRLGLIILGVLADLARTDAMSVLSKESASVSAHPATAST